MKRLGMLRWARLKTLTGGSLRFGLRSKLLGLTALVVLLVSFFTHAYYQSGLAEEFVQGRKDQLMQTASFLKFYGKNRLQGDIVDDEDIRLLLQPFLEDPEFRFVEIRRAGGDEIFMETSHPVFADWLARYEPPSNPVDQSGTTEMQGEQVVYVAFPIMGPKQDDFATDNFDDIESLFADEDDAETSAQASAELDDNTEELKTWVLLGVSADKMMQRVATVRLSSLRVTLPLTVLALVIVYFLLSWLVQPLLAMSRIAAKIARGSFDERVQIEREDEVGDLAHSFNRMTEQIATVFEQIQAAVSHLGEVSSKVNSSSSQVQESSLRQSTAIEEVGASVEEMNRSIREITNNIHFLEQSAEESTASILEMSTTIQQVDEHMNYLGSSVEGTVDNIGSLDELLSQVQVGVKTLQQAAEETASSMHQVDANIRHINDSTQAATELSESVFEDAKKGRTAVERTSEGIRGIKNFSEHMDQVIGGLEQTSGRIVKIVDVIREVAEQTNLLALNANIIAAQAGEHGRGFSVVAQEIKELSDKTSESIQEIARLIDDVQTESRRAGDAMREGREAIDIGMQRSDEAAVALEAILGSTEEGLVRVRSIEHATSEQSRGSHQVANSVQQVAEMVQQLAQNATAQGEQAAQLKEAANKMQNIAHQVRRTTQEQNAGSQLITGSIEKITEMVRQIARSLQEQQSGSDRMLQSTEQIRTTAETNIQYVSHLAEGVRSLNDEVERFQRLIRAFQTEEQA